MISTPVRRTVSSFVPHWGRSKASNAKSRNSRNTTTFNFCLPVANPAHQLPNQAGLCKAKQRLALLAKAPDVENRQKGQQPKQMEKLGISEVHC